MKLERGSDKLAHRCTAVGLHDEAGRAGEITHEATATTQAKHPSRHQAKDNRMFVPKELES